MNISKNGNDIIALLNSKLTVYTALVKIRKYIPLKVYTPKDSSAVNKSIGHTKSPKGGI